MRRTGKTKSRRNSKREECVLNKGKVEDSKQEESIGKV